MSLIKCPECGKEVSTAAAACPSCGYPIAGNVPVAEKTSGPVSNEILMEVRQSWWAYFWHIFFFWLIIPPIIAWWKRAGTVLQIYPGRIMLSRGLFSKCYREFMARDIRAIDIDQSFMNRIVGIGTITISTSATVDADEKITGIPSPQEVRDMILAQRGDS
jgi:uncharacterized membrane protein YdbT with pleckstrin-like domain